MIKKWIYFQVEVRLSASCSENADYDCKAFGACGLDDFGMFYVRHIDPEGQGDFVTAVRREG